MQIRPAGRTELIRLTNIKHNGRWAHPVTLQLVFKRQIAGTDRDRDTRPSQEGGHGSLDS